MVVVFAKCKVLKGEENNFLVLAENSKLETGNISCDLLTESEKNENEFFFLEKWENPDHL